MLKFLKKNGYYIMLGVCVICIGVMITMAVSYSAKFEELRKPSNSPTVTTSPKPSETVKPTQTTKPVDNFPIEFALPVDGAVVGEDYAMDSFVFSETLNQWQAHSGIDFVTDGQADVMACGDGTVVEVITDNILDGNTVVIDHGNDLKSYYKSLAADVAVKEGDVVTKGQVIGKTSTSGYSEFKTGDHVHFEITLKGEYVDPNGYFGSEK